MGPLVVEPRVRSTWHPGSSYGLPPPPSPSSSAHTSSSCLALLACLARLGAPTNLRTLPQGAQLPCAPEGSVRTASRARGRRAQAPDRPCAPRPAGRARPVRTASRGANQLAHAPWSTSPRRPPPSGPQSLSQRFSAVWRPGRAGRRSLARPSIAAILKRCRTASGRLPAPHDRVRGCRRLRKRRGQACLCGRGAAVAPQCSLLVPRIFFSSIPANE